MCVLETLGRKECEVKMTDLMTKILEEATLIDKTEDRNYIRHNISFLLVVANDHERNAVLQNLQGIPKYKNYAKIVGRHNSYVIGIFGKYMVAVLNLKQQGSLRQNASMLSVHEGMDLLSPCGVIVIGIAYGSNEDKENFYDILVSTAIQPVHTLKYNNGKIENRNQIYYASDVLVNIFLNNYDRNDYKNRLVDYNKVISGTILSSEGLINDRDYRDSLINYFSSEDSNIIGGEMEGEGVASVMENLENRHWIVIKSICDFADGNKDDNKEVKQHFAANTVSSYCLKIFGNKQFKEAFKCRFFKNCYKMNIQNPKYYMINSHVMYFYRMKNHLSFPKLERLTEIKESKLRSLENENKSNKNVVNDDEMMKLVKSLDVNIEMLCSKEVNNALKKFYKNKQFDYFVPVKNSKVVFVDFDGTLTVNNKNRTVWELMWEELGYEPIKCKALHRKFTNREISHSEWCDITNDYFRQKDFDYKTMLKVEEKIELIADVEETFRILSENNVKIYILSGAVKEVINDILDFDGKYIDDIVANHFEFDMRTGKLRNIYGTKYDFEGKAQYIENKLEELNLEKSDCIFIGNSNNDEYVGKANIRTLLVNPINTDGFKRDIWMYYLDRIISFKEILPFVLPEIYDLEECIVNKKI